MGRLCNPANAVGGFQITFKDPLCNIPAALLHRIKKLLGQHVIDLAYSLDANEELLVRFFVA